MNHTIFYSHPSKPIEKHIEECLNNCEVLLKKFVKNGEWRKFYFSLLKPICIFHDLGKILDEIQEAIINKRMIKKNHSPLSLLLFESFYDAFKLNIVGGEFYKIVISYIIRKHHSNFTHNLGNLYEDLEEFDSLKKECMEILEKIKRNPNFLEKFNEILINYEIIGEKINVDKWKESLQKLNINELIHKGHRVSTIHISTDELYFLDVLFISSIFLISDRLSAIDIKAEEFFKIYLEDLFKSEIYDMLLNSFNNNYSQLRQSEKQTKINQLRNEAYDEIFSLLNKKTTNLKNIIKIRLPTGMGKTYIGCRLALEIAKMKGIPIIYSLPFINLIEQTENTLSKMLGRENVGKFHHLAFPEDEEKEFERDVLNFFFYPITITSFVQLFHSIFTNRRSMFIKLPIVLNSVWVIDEIQNIPPHFYPLIEDVFRKIIERGFNISIIIMSATIPPIFENEPEVLELPLNKEKYYKELNRYRLEFVEELEIHDYIEKIKKEIEEARNHKEANIIGIITNRVEECILIFKSLKEFFECEKYVTIEDLKNDGIDFLEKEKEKLFKYLKLNSKIEANKTKGCLLERLEKKLDEFKRLVKEETEKRINNIIIENKEKQIGMMYLAANLTSVEKLFRSLLLKDIYNVLKKRNYKLFILCSTQTIEAGVNVDLDLIFRDLAPFDSIVQTAGRVNRNGEKKIGVVKIFKIKICGKYSFDRIYDKFLIFDVTEKIIKKGSKIEERDVLGKLEEFTRNVKYCREKKLSVACGQKKPIQIIRDFEFDYIGKCLRLIEDMPFRITLVSDTVGIFENILEIDEILRKIKDEVSYNDYKKIRIEWYKRYIPLLELISGERSLDTDALRILHELGKNEKIKAKTLLPENLGDFEKRDPPTVFVKEDAKIYFYYGFDFKPEVNIL